MAQDTQFVHGAQRLSRRIETIRSRLALPVLTPKIGELLLRRTLDRFDNEVDPDGQRWKPLTEGTLKRRGYLEGNTKKMLVRTRMLRDSIQIIRGGVDSTFFNTGAGVRIGIPPTAIDERGELVSVYAAIQNRTRRFLGVGRLDVKAVDSLLRRAGADALSE